MSKIVCPKCGNDHYFEAVISSVFSIYFDGTGKTVAKEPLTEACTGVNRVECTVCRTQLDVDYDLRTERGIPYRDQYAQLKPVTM
ncbi:MAG: hypothetical protein M1503_12380 [Thaumarchaeota archaeon]|nr:hypothetical protein [Nitrososphaerota archaeon]MCL5319037.1 hypothetical protein [Nitrososphaerota archaeon]